MLLFYTIFRTLIHGIIEVWLAQPNKISYFYLIINFKARRHNLLIKNLSHKDIRKKYPLRLKMIAGINQILFIYKAKHILVYSNRAKSTVNYDRKRIQIHGT